MTSISDLTKFFGDGNSPQMFEQSLVGQRAMAELRTRGFSVELSKSGICICHPSPAGLREWYYNRRNFLVRAEKLTGRSWITDDQPPRNDHHTRQDASSAPETPEETIARLRVSGRKIIEQREAWKERALVAERELMDLRNRAGNAGNGDGRYGKLKRVIAQELHPDNQVAGIEKIVKAEIFKTLWVRIQDIEKDG